MIFRSALIRPHVERVIYSALPLVADRGCDGGGPLNLVTAPIALWHRGGGEDGI